MRVRGPSSVLPVLPIAAAAALILLANASFIAFRLALPYPMSPWEAGIVTDAWRMLHGEHVYAAGSGHATHMYGPLVTVVLSQIFRFTGPDLHVGRILSVLSGFAVVAILARLFVSGGRLAYWIAAALLLGANSHTMYYFTETRPDLDSLFLALLALILIHRGLETAAGHPRLMPVFAGTALLVAAALFKQTALMFSVVPALATLGRWRRPSFRAAMLAASLPIAGVLASFVAIRLFLPGAWHFLVEVPAQYPTHLWRAVRAAADIVMSLALFVLALMHWLFTEASGAAKSPRARWLLAALICTILPSALALTKFGGGSNSLIPALLCLGAFCAWRVAVGLAMLRDPSRPLRVRIAAGTILALLLVVYAIPGFTPAFPPVVETLSRGGGR